MIPVTVFAGKKVAIFGLGGSGLASASALLAGGADVIGWDDNAESVVKATSAGIPTADLREVDWSRHGGAGARAGRAADASGPALVGRACARRRRRGDRRHRAVLPRAAPDRTDGAVRRHHRHQRQVDHHRADRAPPALGRPRRPDGRQYRHRDPVARAAGRRPRLRDRMLVLSDRSRADARSVGRHSSQHHRGSSRPAWDAAALRRREGAPRRGGAGGRNRDRRRRR